MVAIARVEDGQDCVLPQKIPAADTLSLIEVDAQIRHAKNAPIERGAGLSENPAGDAAAAAVAPADAG